MLWRESGIRGMHCYCNAIACAIVYEGRARGSYSILPLPRLRRPCSRVPGVQSGCYSFCRYRRNGTGHAHVMFSHYSTRSVLRGVVAVLVCPITNTRCVTSTSGHPSRPIGCVRRYLRTSPIYCSDQDPASSRPPNNIGTNSSGASQVLLLPYTLSSPRYSLLWHYQDFLPARNGSQSVVMQVRAQECAPCASRRKVNSFVVFVVCTQIFSVHRYDK